MQAPGHGGGDDDLPSGPDDRLRDWVHPSEVGLHRRTRTDRRRGAWLAAALMTAGIGLLAVGVSIGLGGSRTATSATRPPSESIASNLASLTVVTARGRHSATGVVLDGNGHVATRSPVPTDAVEVWASCGGRQPVPVEISAHDETTGITILTLPPGSGRPVVPRSSITSGADVLIATAGTGESAPTVRPGSLDAVGLRFIDLLDAAATHQPLGITSGHHPTTSTSVTSPGAPSDGAAFDGQGRFVGLVIARGADERTSVLPADVVFDVLTRLVG